MKQGKMLLQFCLNFDSMPHTIRSVNCNAIRSEMGKSSIEKKNESKLKRIVSAEELLKWCLFNFITDDFIELKIPHCLPNFYIYKFSFFEFIFFSSI